MTIPAFLDLGQASLPSPRRAAPPAQQASDDNRGAFAAMVSQERDRQASRPSVDTSAARTNAPSQEASDEDSFARDQDTEDRKTASRSEADSKTATAPRSTGAEDYSADATEIKDTGDADQPASQTLNASFETEAIGDRTPSGQDGVPNNAQVGVDDALTPNKAIPGPLVASELAPQEGGDVEASLVGRESTRSQSLAEGGGAPNANDRSRIALPATPALFAAEQDGSAATVAVDEGKSADTADSPAPTTTRGAADAAPQKSETLQVATRLGDGRVSPTSTGGSSSVMVTAGSDLQSAARLPEGDSLRRSAPPQASFSDLPARAGQTLDKSTSQGGTSMPVQVSSTLPSPLEEKPRLGASDSLGVAIGASGSTDDAVQRIGQMPLSERAPMGAVPEPRATSQNQSKPNTAVLGIASEAVGSPAKVISDGKADVAESMLSVQMRSQMGDGTRSSATSLPYTSPQPPTVAQLRVDALSETRPNQGRFEATSVPSTRHVADGISRRAAEAVNAAARPAHVWEETSAPGAAMTPSIGGDRSDGAQPADPSLAEGRRGAAAHIGLEGQHRAPSVPPAAHQVLEAMRQNSIAVQNPGSLEVALHPEDLGRVRLVFTPADAGLTVTIQADRAETLDVLRRHIDLLGQDLLAQGYGDVAFDFAGGQDNQAASHQDESAEELSSPSADPLARIAQGQADASAASGGAATNEAAGLDLRL